MHKNLTSFCLGTLLLGLSVPTEAADITVTAGAVDDLVKREL